MVVSTMPTLSLVTEKEGAAYALKDLLSVHLLAPNDGVLRKRWSSKYTKDYASLRCQGSFSHGCEASAVNVKVLAADQADC